MKLRTTTSLVTWGNELYIMSPLLLAVDPILFVLPGDHETMLWTSYGPPSGNLDLGNVEGRPIEPKPATCQS